MSNTHNFLPSQLNIPIWLTKPYIVIGISIA